MNGRFFQSLPVVVLALAALASVAAFAAGTGNYAFAPPTGWTKLAGGTNLKWADPSGTEYLMLHPTTYTGDLNQFVTAMLKKEKNQYITLHLWTNRNYYICGSHLGRYLIWTALSGGHTKVGEQMLAVWAQDGYVITYLRPQNHPPSRAARTSLLSICGVGQTIQPQGGVPVAPPASNVQNNSQSQGGEPGPVIDEPSPYPTGTIPHPYVPVIPGGG